MDRAHTKGPWVLDGHNMSSVLKCTVPRGDPKACHLAGDYDIIARCFSDNWRNDARLIAAAPDMFEALLTALPYIECAEEDEAYKPGVVAKVTAQIRAAIAKAEGLGQRADATLKSLTLSSPQESGR